MDKISPLLRLLLLSILTIPISIQGTYGQKTKQVEIYKNKMLKDYLDVNYHYDDNNNVTSTQVMLYGQDLRYQQIVELVTIYYGSPKGTMKFLIDVEKFVNENDPDVSTTIEGCRISIVKQMGIKGFYIYEKDASGYRGYNMKTWGKIKEALIEWAEKNSEPLE